MERCAAPNGEIFEFLEIERAAGPFEGRKIYLLFCLNLMLFQLHAFSHKFDVWRGVAYRHILFRIACYIDIMQLEFNCGKCVRALALLAGCGFSLFPLVES